MIRRAYIQLKVLHEIAAPASTLLYFTLSACLAFSLLSLWLR